MRLPTVLPFLCGTLLFNATATLAQIGPVFPVGAAPIDVAVNPSTHRVFVSNQGNQLNPVGSVTIVDGALGNVIATLTVGPSVLRGIGIDTARNRVYVGALFESNQNRVVAIDGSTLAFHVVSSFVSGTIGDIEANPVTGRVYVADQTNNRVFVFDGDTEALVATVSIPYQPFGIAVDPLTNRIYVGQAGASDPTAGIAVIDGSTHSVMGMVALGHGVLSIAVNPSTKKLYATTNGAQVLEVIAQ